jgi:hypothetical protein
MDPLVCKVTEERARRACAEVHKVFPDAECRIEYDDEGRGIIKFVVERCLVDVEFIETPDSWHHKNRLREYANNIASKCRVVVLIPEPHALKARLKMLELNMAWLYYYQVYGYEEDGSMRHLSTIHIKGCQDSPVLDQIRGYA